MFLVWIGDLAFAGGRLEPNPREHYEGKCERRTQTEQPEMFDLANDQTGSQNIRFRAASLVSITCPPPGRRYIQQNRVDTHLHRLGKACHYLTRICILEGGAGGPGDG